jgi:hypothetical protein
MLHNSTGCLLHQKQQNAVTIGYSTLRCLRKHFLGFTGKIPLAENLFMRRVFAVFEVRLRVFEMRPAPYNSAPLDQGYRTYLDASKILNSYNYFRGARRFPIGFESAKRLG